jgi:hypothetical protein
MAPADDGTAAEQDGSSSAASGSSTQSSMLKAFQLYSKADVPGILGIQAIDLARIHVSALYMVKATAAQPSDIRAALILQYLINCIPTNTNLHRMVVQIQATLSEELALADLGWYPSGQLTAAMCELIMQPHCDRSVLQHVQDSLTERYGLAAQHAYVSGYQLQETGLDRDQAVSMIRHHKLTPADWRRLGGLAGARAARSPKQESRSILAPQPPPLQFPDLQAAITISAAAAATSAAASQSSAAAPLQPPAGAGQAAAGAAQQQEEESEQSTADDPPPVGVAQPPVTAPPPAAVGAGQQQQLAQAVTDPVALAVLMSAHAQIQLAQQQMEAQQRQQQQQQADKLAKQEQTTLVVSGAEWSAGLAIMEVIFALLYAFIGMAGIDALRQYLALSAPGAQGKDNFMAWAERCDRLYRAVKHLPGMAAGDVPSVPFLDGLSNTEAQRRGRQLTDDAVLKGLPKPSAQELALQLTRWQSSEMERQQQRLKVQAVTGFVPAGLSSAGSSSNSRAAGSGSQSEVNEKFAEEKVEAAIAHITAAAIKQGYRAAGRIAYEKRSPRPNGLCHKCPLGGTDSKGNPRTPHLNATCRQQQKAKARPAAAAGVVAPAASTSSTEARPAVGAAASAQPQPPGLSGSGNSDLPQSFLGWQPSPAAFMEFCMAMAGQGFPRNGPAMQDRQQGRPQPQQQQQQQYSQQQGPPCSICGYEKGHGRGTCYYDDPAHAHKNGWNGPGASASDQAVLHYLQSCLRDGQQPRLRKVQTQLERLRARNQLPAGWQPQPQHQQPPYQPPYQQRQQPMQRAGMAADMHTAYWQQPALQPPQSPYAAYPNAPGSVAGSSVSWQQPPATVYGAPGPAAYQPAAAAGVVQPPYGRPASSAAEGVYAPNIYQPHMALAGVVLPSAADEPVSYQVGLVATRGQARQPAAPAAAAPAPAPQVPQQQQQQPQSQPAGQPRPRRPQGFLPPQMVPQEANTQEGGRAHPVPAGEPRFTGSPAAPPADAAAVPGTTYLAGDEGTAFIDQMLQLLADGMPLLARHSPQLHSRFQQQLRALLDEEQLRGSALLALCLDTFHQYPVLWERLGDRLDSILPAGTDSVAVAASVPAADTAAASAAASGSLQPAQQVQQLQQQRLAAPTSSSCCLTGHPTALSRSGSGVVATTLWTWSSQSQGGCRLSSPCPPAAGSHWRGAWWTMAPTCR